jgi:hypothetical protein
VAAFTHPGSDPSQCKPTGFQLQVHHLDAVASSFPSKDATSITQSAECRFEREVRSFRRQAIDFCSTSRPALTAASLGSSGDRPPAMRSAFTKWTTPASAGKYRRAKVVFPAPLGPAITMQRGGLFRLGILQAYRFGRAVGLSACALRPHPCSDAYPTLTAFPTLFRRPQAI